MYRYKNSFDNISISSFKKRNVRSLAEQVIVDVKILQKYLHKIFYLRLLYYKSSIVSSCISLRRYRLSISNFTFEQYSFYNCYNIILHSQYYLYNSLIFSYHYVINIHHTMHLWTIFLSRIRLFLDYFLYFYFFLFFINIQFFFFNSRNGFASLPTTISKFTVLKSPHTDKKSREQFEIRTHKRVYRFKTIFSSYFERVCKYNYNSFFCNYVYTSTFFIYS